VQAIAYYLVVQRLRIEWVPGPAYVVQFLTHLAMERRGAASTQNQAFAAILWPYRDVLGSPLPRLEGIARARRSPRVPVVLTRDEVRRVIDQLSRVQRLMVLLLCGSGLRLRVGRQRAHFLKVF